MLVLVLITAALFSVAPTSAKASPGEEYGVSSLPSENSVKATAKWTYMVYLNGDNSLSSYTDGDLSEMEAGYNDAALNDVNLICLWDKSTSGDTKLIKVYNGGYDDISSTAPWWSSEMDMGDPQTLIDFVEWTVQNYPAQYYFLDLWDHGGDYDGAMWDDSSGTNLDLAALRYASRTIYQDLGFPMDIWGYDACLMNAGADNYQIKLAADIILASEHTEGGDGWDYTALIGNLTNNPNQTPEQYAYAHVVHVDDEGSRTGIVTMAAINTTKWDYYWIPAYNALAQKLKHKAGTEGSNIQNALSAAVSADSSYWSTGKDVADIAVQLKSSVSDPEILYWADRLLENSTSSQGVGVNTCVINSYDTDTSGKKLTMAETTSTSEVDSSFYIFIENQWDEMLNQVYNVGTDVNNNEPTVAIDSPSDGAKIAKADGTVTITGTAADSDGTVQKVQVKIDRDDWIDATGTTSWSYTWDLTNVSLGWHHIMARSYDGTDFSEYWPSIDVEIIPNSPPSLTLIYPKGGEILSGNVNIQWNATDADGDPITIDLYYSADGGKTWNTIASGEPNDGSYLWDTTGLADGVNYMVRVNATDTVPQTSTVDSDPVSIDNIADDQWFLQIQTPGVVGYQNLSMEPVELSANTLSTQVTAAGDYFIGSTGWLTHSFPEAKSIDGNWTFNIWGKVTDSTTIGGHLYAKIYRYDGSSSTLLYTTSQDDEDVSLYTTEHLFSWTDWVTGSINSGDSIGVEIWLNATKGASSSNISDYAYWETSVYGTQTGNYTDTEVSDNNYEELTETSGSLTETILSENFDEGGNIPSGWTIENLGTAGGWQMTLQSGSDYWAYDDSDAAGSSATQDDYLISPIIDCSAYTTVTLQFYNDYKPYDETSSEGAYVDVSNDGGSTWTNVYHNYQTTVAQTETLNITSIAAGYSQVQIRWHYVASWDWHWGVDDVLVTGTVPTSVMEHKWAIEVTGGGTGVVFAVEAYHTSNTEGDDFDFYYSTDDSTYTYMLTITKTSDDDTEQTYTLPSSLNGTVYIKVVDTDRTAGNTNSDTLYIDKMVIRTEVGPPEFVISYDYGDTQSNVIPSLSAPPPSITVNLEAGWNLISLPWLNTPTAITDALSGISWDRAMVYENGVWKTYDVNRLAKYNLGFPTVDNTVGIWVYTTSAETLSGPGNDLGSTDIYLGLGWNLIGYPSNTVRTVSDALSTFTGTYDYVQMYDPNAGTIVTLTATDTMEPGYGYWIHVTSPGTLTVYW